jgi:hypothetical protein
MAGWSSNPWANQKILDFELTGPSDLAYMHADVFAVAPYFGGPNAPAFTEEEIAAMTVEDVLDISEGYIQDTLAAGSVTEENFELAMTRGLVLVAYEGGQHIAAKSNDIANNTTITALFLAANRHPRMRQMYLDYLTLWSSRSVGPFFHYNHTGSYDKWGSWGLLETQNQSRASAYKWLGVHDWLDTVWN